MSAAVEKPIMLRRRRFRHTWRAFAPPLSSSEYQRTSSTTSLVPASQPAFRNSNTKRYASFGPGPRSSGGDHLEPAEHARRAGVVLARRAEILAAPGVRHGCSFEAR